MQNYTFTQDQVNQILAVLADVPAKFSFQAILMINQVCQTPAEPPVEEIKE